MTVPAQAIVESEPFGWWTSGRRVRIGRGVAARAQAAGVTLPGAVTLTSLPVPYDRLNGSGPDGRLLWEQRSALGLLDAWFGLPAPPRVEPVDMWNPAELSYSTELSRVGFVHQFQPLSGQELQGAIEHQWVQLGLDMANDQHVDTAVINAIARVTGSNFRLVQRLFAQIERIVTINNLPAVTTEVVTLARERLVEGAS
jgi:hypothetical protein